ncbi:MAG TPA: GYF domain-containing protein, partial [Arenimonas sp.]|nr:GYF domain-containing protein [Arenimonas sp.]
MSSWFYVDGGQNRQGPVGVDALVQAYRLGQVSLESLVWREGLSEWVPLGQFRDELGLAGVTPVLPPAATMPPAAQAAPEAKKNNGCLIAAAIIVGGGLFLIFILGILAAIAVPAYQDYLTRSKLAIVRVEAQAAEVAVEQFKANTDRCPRDAEELGLSPPTTPGLQMLEVGSLDDGRCAVELTLGELGNDRSAAGGRLLMTQEADGTWTCSADGVPEKLLPTDCR